MKRIFTRIVILFLIACQPVPSAGPELRPEPVPVSALWIGGADGGVYVDINRDDKNYSGTVYTDSTGDVWYSGSFIYSGTAEFDVKSAESYTGWDGEMLYLANGEYLKAEQL
ncbi:hypothetical protein [Rheinheimera fenheensis]|uniref:hypothetical protein n=1 Tax=Rheinheimera fenheensis TaxID=3152295 RepID=UPI00325ED6E6